MVVLTSDGDLLALPRPVAAPVNLPHLVDSTTLQWGAHQDPVGVRWGGGGKGWEEVFFGGGSGGMTPPSPPYPPSSVVPNWATVCPKAPPTSPRKTITVSTSTPEPRQEVSAVEWGFFLGGGEEGGK